MDWIIEHVEALIVLVVAVVIVFVVGMIVMAPEWPDADPAKNWHAKACLDAGRTIKHHNHGGRDNSKTYWCVTSDGQITDLWFS